MPNIILVFNVLLYEFKIHLKFTSLFIKLKLE